MKQLPLSLMLRDDATFANYYPGNNQAAVAAVRNLILPNADDPTADSMLYLFGGSGVGRTHLLQAACHQATEHGWCSAYIPLAEAAAFSPDMLDDLEQLDLVCIDDLHCVAGERSWEEALFHLYNRLRDSKSRLLVVADDRPQQLNLLLPDLVSRLSWGLVYQLHRLTDDDKIAALAARAAARGLEISATVGQYLLRHGPRDMSALFAILETLDRASLAAQRRLTIPFVKQALFDSEPFVSVANAKEY